MTRTRYVTPRNVKALTWTQMAAMSTCSTSGRIFAQLQQQIASTPTPVPVVMPPDPKAAEALNAVLELAKALKLAQAA